MIDTWLIYRHKDRLNMPTAKKFTGTTEEIEKEMNEFVDERPHIEAIDVAESIYKEYCEED